MKNDIDDITAYLLQTYGIDLSIYEDDFLRKLLDKRMSVTGNDSFHTYFQYLKSYKVEIDTLFESLHISFSEFFRNPLTFSIIEQIILPFVIEKKKIAKDGGIRVWSAACASGQEAYSFAMIFDEVIENMKTNCSCRIFATDINQVELSNALRGSYHAASLNKVTLKRIQKYFTLQGEDFIISSALREYIDFSVFDLLAQQGDAPAASVYGNFDFIFCSNVLFYYKPEFQTRILGKLSNSLATGGYLITGETERSILKDNHFREIYINSGIFQKTNSRREKMH